MCCHAADISVDIHTLRSVRVSDICMFSMSICWVVQTGLLGRTSVGGWHTAVLLVALLQVSSPRMLCCDPCMRVPVVLKLNLNMEFSRDHNKSADHVLTSIHMHAGMLKHVDCKYDYMYGYGYYK